MRADYEVWLEFLNEPQSVYMPFIDFSMYLVANEINFFTDASKKETLGFSCVFDNSWTYSIWEPGFVSHFDLSIKYLDLFAVAVAVDLWAHRLQNK